MSHSKVAVPYICYLLHLNIRPIRTILHDTPMDMLSIILILQINSKQEIISIQSISPTPQLHSWSALNYFIGYEKSVY